MKRIGPLTRRHATRVLIGALLVAQLAVAATSQAVVVELQGNGRVIHGHLIELTPETLVVERESVEGATEQLEFSRSEIAKLTLNVSDQRLASLDPGQPTGYFQYAEELFPLRDDPDARLIALRLYLIAAQLDDQQFGERALARLTELARSAAEQKKFRTMHYLFQARRQGAPPTALSDQLDTVFLESSAVDEALLGLRSLRAGDRRLALKYLAKLEVRQAIDRFHGELGAAQLQQLAYGKCGSCLDGRTNCDRCDGRGEIAASGGNLPCASCRSSGLIQCGTCRGRDFFTRPGDQALRKILTLELEIHHQRENAKREIAERPSPAEGFRNWAQAQQESQHAIVSLNWSNVTEIDPRQSVFLGDRWVRP